MESVQVDKKHYSITSYGFEGRFISYYRQLHEILSRDPSSVLEVGVGDKIVGSFITQNTPVAYTSVDIAEDLHPDILGSITELPLPDDAYDISCAFEVLEHIPFEDFERAVGELCRVARKTVIISIPHFGPMIAFSLKIPFLPLTQFAVKLPVPKKHVFNGQHYWELGKQGYSLGRIRAALARHGTIEKDYVPFNSFYHHFFVLRPTGKG
jgi:SAM-dependent methyltransferase